MKKMIAALALTALIAGTAHAQVYSANTVGLVKIQVTSGQLQLVALNFVPNSTFVNDLIGDQLPPNSVIHVWDKDNHVYNSISYTTSRTGTNWPNDAEINNGDAFWIQAAGTGTHDVVLAGEVLAGDLTTSIPDGLVATGYFYPVETTFGETDLAALLPANSVLHVWNGSAYQSFTKTTSRTGTDWTAEAKAIVIGPGDGFWIQAPATTWNEVQPY